MYVTKQENKNAIEFNSHLRAHDNALENQPIYLPLIAIAGWKWPLLTFVIYMSLIFTGRITYAWGYYAGPPEKRYQGLLPFTLGVVFLRCLAVAYAFELINQRLPSS